MIQSLLWMSFTAGLLGGLGHCSGMCGPIVGAFSVSATARARSPLIPQMLYNFGRVTTYTALGAVFGGVGSFVGLASGMEWAQYAVRVLTGALMLLMGLSVAGLTGGMLNKLESHNSLVLRAARSVRGAEAWRFLPLGLMLGFLPCGLSYSMFMASAGSGGAAEGAINMLAFGLGTVPAMLLIGYLAGRLGSALRGRLYRLGGMVVALMGVYYIYGGLSFYAHM